MQPQGGHMVCRLSLVGCELASNEALATLLRVTDLMQLCLYRCVRLADAALDVIATQPSLTRVCRICAPSPSARTFA